MTTSVFLVRHAAHCDLGRRLTGRADDARLSDVGECQAAALGRRLAGEGLSVIYTSPRQRARATGEAIARMAHAPIRIAPALDEIDYGDWTGTDFAMLEKERLWRQWNEARHVARPPNGECMAAAVARMVGHLEGLAREHAGERIAAVTHCDMIRGAVTHYLGLPLRHMLRFDIECGSISTLQFGAEGARLVRLNESALR